MNFLPEILEAYATDHTSPESEVLAELNRETHAKVLYPRMLSGHLQGRFLTMISQMIRPGRILEIGTYTGYSAICMAPGLKENGLIHTIDINDELGPMVKKYIEKAGFSDKIQCHYGSGLDIIPTLDEKFDLVFIDADKENYKAYYQLVFDKVNPGGFIIADNVLWSGKVLKKEDTLDPETKALADYNEFIRQDNRVENILLPLRDGLMIARKK